MPFSANVALSGRVESARGCPLSEQDMRPGVREQLMRTTFLSRWYNFSGKLQDFRLLNQGDKKSAR
jgi:hypothetical protein